MIQIIDRPDAPPEIHALFMQLAVDRDAFRAEKADALPRIDTANRLLAEAKATRAKVRKRAAKLLVKLRQKFTTQDAKREGERLQLERDRAAHAAAVNTLYSERNRLTSEAAEHCTQLEESWNALHAAQTQLATERAQLAAEQSTMFQLLDTRRAELQTAEQTFREKKLAFEMKSTGVKQELIGLEQRAANAREVITQLEQTRVRHAADVATTAALAPIDGGLTGMAGHVANSFEEREAQIAHEKRTLAHARRELATFAEHLTDQRAILVEQHAQLLQMQADWQRAEVHTVEELETLTQELAHRERLADAQTDAQSAVDLRQQSRETTLATLHATLERWQLALSERESRFHADRREAEVGLGIRRGHLADRETNLDFFCQKLTAENSRLREALVAELRAWDADRRAANRLAEACERDRQELIDNGRHLAAASLAIAQTEQELADKDHTKWAARRVRVLKKTWERHYEQLSQALDSRLKTLHETTNATEARQREWHGILVPELTTAIQYAAHDTRSMVTRYRAENPPEEEPLILSIADARRKISDEQLKAMRTEATELLNTTRAA